MGSTKDYYRDFEYPMKGNIESYMEELSRGQDPSVNPINDHDYMMIHQAKGKCTLDLDSDDDQDKSIRIVYLVKSAMDHFKQREVIRKTWGYEKRFSDVPIRTVFLLGSSKDPHDELMKKIKDEYDEFGDIVQGNFIDTYYNNTIKTMMGLRWAVEHCPKSRFYMVVDDDYYVSARNLLRFLRNPVNYPGYLQEDVITFDEEKLKEQIKSRHLNQVVEEEEKEPETFDPIHLR